jgi:hypothetical protein
MAAIVSTELIAYISPVLIFIFVWAVLYGVLQKFEAFGKNQPINAAIAFSVSLLFVMIPFFGEIVKNFVPLIVIMILIIVVILIMLMFLGYKETDIVSYMKINSLGTVIVIIVLFLFIFVLGNVLGPAFTQYPSSIETSVGSNLRRVFLNPKVLGMILMFSIAFYLIKAIAAPVTNK